MTYVFFFFLFELFKREVQICLVCSGSFISFKPSFMFLIGMHLSNFNQINNTSWSVKENLRECIGTQFSSWTFSQNLLNCQRLGTDIYKFRSKKAGDLFSYEGVVPPTLEKEDKKDRKKPVYGYRQFEISNHYPLLSQRLFCGTLHFMSTKRRR
jgi:hypothetical protein